MFFFWDDVILLSRVVSFHTGLTVQLMVLLGNHLLFLFFLVFRAEHSTHDDDMIEHELTLMLYLNVKNKKLLIYKRE